MTSVRIGATWLNNSASWAASCTDVIPGPGYGNSARGLGNWWASRSRWRRSKGVLVRRDDCFISASESGAWWYCQKAWHLSQRGYVSSLVEERAAGSRYHKSHNLALRVAR